MNKKIKILYVHHYPGMGGATMSLFYIIERLDTTFFDVTVLFLGEGEGVDYFRGKGINVITYPKASIYPHADNSKLSFIGKHPFLPIKQWIDMRNDVPKLVNWFKNNPFDIIHLNTSLLLPFGKAASKAKINLVWHLREPLNRGMLGVRYNKIRRWINNYADHIFSISNIEAQRIGVSEKVTVVYNYIDFNKFDWKISGQPIRQELGLKENEFVVLNLGGLIHSKGADVFVEAAKILVDKYNDIKFIIAGDKGTLTTSNLLSKIKSIIRQALNLKVNKGYAVYRRILDYGLESKIVLTGMRTDIPQLIAASDILCWSATVPHFSRPIIEAAAMKKPSVATNFPNTLETLEPEKTGLLFKNKDAKAMANKIEELYLDRHKMTELGENAYVLALQKFNAENNFKLIYKKYLDLMGIKH